MFVGVAIDLVARAVRFTLKLKPLDMSIVIVLPSVSDTSAAASKTSAGASAVLLDVPVLNSVPVEILMTVVLVLDAVLPTMSPVTVRVPVKVSVVFLSAALAFAKAATVTPKFVLPLAKDELAFDYSSLELYKLEESAVRDLPYTEQEGFFAGENNNTTEESSASSSMDW